jgi:hypothetical protein
MSFLADVLDTMHASPAKRTICGRGDDFKVEDVDEAEATRMPDAPSGSWHDGLAQPCVLV